MRFVRTRSKPLVVKGKRDRVMAYRLLEVVPGAPAHARRFDSEMVGRDRELALLGDAYARAVRGALEPPLHSARPRRCREVAPGHGGTTGGWRCRYLRHRQLSSLRRGHHVLARAGDRQADHRHLGGGFPRRSTEAACRSLPRRRRRSGGGARAWPSSSASPTRPCPQKKGSGQCGACSRRLRTRSPWSWSSTI